TWGTGRSKGLGDGRLQTSVRRLRALTGDRMGRQLAGLGLDAKSFGACAIARLNAIVSFDAIVRLGALAAGCLLLANCSGPFAGKEAKYSQRVVEEGESAPKGGGRYSVGKPYSINGRTY